MMIRRLPLALLSLLPALFFQAQASPTRIRIPPAFELNEGQTDPAVRYLARIPGGVLYLLQDEVVYAPRASKRGEAESGRGGGGSALHVRFLGANPSCELVPEEPQPGVSNYFIGNDPSRWRSGVPRFGSVRYPNLYPGVDLVHRPGEYDFELAPGADPSVIRLRVEGTDCLQLDGDGDVTFGVGDLRHRRPKVYLAGGTERLEGRFVRLGRNELGFEVAGSHLEGTLVIDPVFEFGTYLGGSGGEAGSFPTVDIAVGPAGNIYVAGGTGSVDFPVKSALQGTKAGFDDAFITCLSADGTSLVFSTYVGGAAREDDASSIAVDAQGDIYVAGDTTSFDFPVTPGSFRPFYSGLGDGFICKLAPGGGSLLYSSFLGGSNGDDLWDLVLDAAGNAYVVGFTMSRNFPKVNPYQAFSGQQDVFVSKVSNDGSTLLYSTLLGGSNVNYGHGIALDSTGAFWVTGFTDTLDFPLVKPFLPLPPAWDNIFITRFAPDGQSLLFSTLYGGTMQDWGLAIAVDSTDAPVLTGFTTSKDFPLVNPYQSSCGTQLQCFSGEAFVLKLKPGGAGVEFSTFLGGTGYDQGKRIAFDGSDNIYIAVDSERYGGPSPCSMQPPSPSVFGLLGMYDPSGQVQWLTAFGATGSPIGVALDGGGSIYVAGLTFGPGMPVTMGSVQPTYGGGNTDAYIAKIVPGDCGPVTADFDASLVQGPAPLPVRFTPLLHGPILTHDWDFGDSAASDALSPRHVYTVPGTYDVSLTVTGNGTSDTAVKPRYIHVTSASPSPDNLLAGPGPSSTNPNEVRILSTSGVLFQSWLAYGAGRYGTNVAAGDLDDGGAEALTGPGPGAVYGPQVRAFDRSGKPLAKVSFYAYGTLRYGVKTASGDLDHDWFDEILTGAGPGDVFGPHVRGFNYDGIALTALAKLSFFAYQTLKFGVNVAGGDIDGDIYAEILTGPGPSPYFAPQARAFDFDGRGVAAIPGSNGNVFPAPQYGLNVASGDVTGDGEFDALYGPGPGPSIGARLRGFALPPLAPLPGFDIQLFAARSYGLKPAAADIDADGKAEPLAGQGEDPSAATRLVGFAYDGAALTPYPGLDFDAFPGLSYGVNPAGGAYGY